MFRHAALTVVFATLVTATAEQPQAPPWSLTEAQIDTIVSGVRAGRDLSPSSWPGGARVAVGLSFDVDNETWWLDEARPSPSSLSQGEYGARAGLPRILSLLERHRIPASFFVPAVSALIAPDSIRAIVRPGVHEIALHGWIHEGNSALDEATERELMRRSLDRLERLAGRRPVGMRTPSWDYSPYTIGLARELGLVYDSSLMADDDPYEVLANGEPTGIVELPVEWILDDYPYFWMDRSEPVRPVLNPDEVLAIWRAEFDVAYEEGGLFILTMHPHVIGHRSRMRMLEQLVAHMQAKPGVWFATHEQIARHVREGL